MGLSLRFRPMIGLALILVFLFGASVSLPASDTVVFVHDTHMHGGLEGPSIFVKDNPSGTTPLNMASYFGLVEQIRDRRGDSYVRVLGSGDDLIGHLEGWEFRGKNMVEAFNAGGLDYNTYGNHEFDAGPAVVRRRVAESQFRWLSANVVDSSDSEVFGKTQGADSYAIETINGVRVGFTGYVHDTAPRNTLMGHRVRWMEKVDVLDPVSALGDVVSAMRDAGVDIVVVMNHGGSDPGEVREIARQVNGIDLIVGDHDDTVTCSRVTGTPFCEPEYINGATIVLIGDEYLHLGETRFTVNDTGTITDTEVIRHDLRSGTDAVTGDAVTPHPAVKTVMDTYLQAYYDKYLDTVGRTVVPFDARQSTLWTGESAVGDFYADATRPVFDADASVHVPLMWSDMQYPAGPLHHLDIYRTFSLGAIVDPNVFAPATDMIVKMELTGDSIARLMGFALSLDRPNPLFPSVSGMWYAYHPNASSPSSSVSHIYIDGQPLDRSKTYEIATKSFLARPQVFASRVGGIGPGTLPPAVTQTVGKAQILNRTLVPVQQAIVDKIQRETPIEPEVAGRVSVVTDTGPSTFGDSVTLDNADLGRGAPEAAPPFELSLRVDSGAAASTPTFSVFALGPTHPRVQNVRAADTTFQVALNVTPDSPVNSDSVTLTLDASRADTAGFRSFQPAVFEPDTGWVRVDSSRVVRRDGARITFHPPHFSSFAVVSGSGTRADGGTCLVERMGLPDFVTEAVRTLRDRALQTDSGRWITAIYYRLSRKL